MEEKMNELNEVENIEKVNTEGIEIEEGIFKYIDEKNDEEILKVTTKDGVFSLKEVAYNKIRSAIKRGKTSDREELCILSELIFEKNGEKAKIGELELDNYKGSTIVKLARAMNSLIDISDFRE